MTTIHLTNRKGNKLQLSGDLLTGDTFAIKDYIKAHMDGKWVADQKAWRVNVAKVNRLIEQSLLTIDNEAAAAAPVTRTTSGHLTYAEFARLMNDPNSDL